MSFKVPFIDLPGQYESLKEEIQRTLQDVLSSGRLILRQEVSDFENEMSRFLGVKHVVGVNSGTDALFLSAKALGIGPGDEVITVTHTFVATLAVVVHCGATPTFVDIRQDFNMDPSQLESAVTQDTKAIIPVHLNGRACEMDNIKAVADRYGLVVIEDVAQGLGSKFQNKSVGTFGNTGCFSLHPLKNLSVGGDGGFVSTDDDQIADKLRLLRDHGQKTKQELSGYGFNSRLDNLHAALALVKMKRLPQWLERRRELASRYEEGLRPIEDLGLPNAPGLNSDYYDVYNSYVVRSDRRNKLLAHLINQGIEVFAHLSPPLHYQKSLGLSHWKLPVTEKMADEVLSLPIYPELSDDKQDIVINEVRSFFGA